jgi:hypothetical protein
VSRVAVASSSEPHAATATREDRGTHDREGTRAVAARAQGWISLVTLLTA